MKVYALFIVLAASALQTRAQKVKIDVLYESLCPDSLNFIINQLYPAYGEIGQYVDLNFIPFGKSASTSKTEFMCQHGPKECMGNRLQSCALHNLPHQADQNEFVNCFMTTYMQSRGGNINVAQICATGVELPWSTVKECYDSDLGTQLQLQAEVDTLKVKPRFVPTIVYNGVFNQRSQDESQYNFKGVACAHIKQLHPDAC